MLLAALMLVSCLSPAFAEEGEQAQTDYERWGSYLNWTDGQKAEAFHNWDDERWDAYCTVPTTTTRASTGPAAWSWSKMMRP